MSWGGGRACVRLLFLCVNIFFLYLDAWRRSHTPLAVATSPNLGEDGEEIFVREGRGGGEAGLRLGREYVFLTLICR